MKTVLYPVVTLVLFMLEVAAHGQAPTLQKQLEDYRAAGVEKRLVTNGVEPDSVIAAAHYYLGVKHKLYGTSMEGLDCSGLIYKSFMKYGIRIPRSSTEQGRYGTLIYEISQLKRGDLVFFHRNWSSRLVNHVGIYLGNNEFIHVSSVKGCIVAKLSDKDKKSGFLFGTRVW